MTRPSLLALALLSTTAVPGWAEGEPRPTIAALKGLAAVTALPASAIGRVALGANLAVTGGIQTGTLRQATLMPFAEQQQQALRDAFITDGNLAQLADGLGTTLGAAYLARAHSLDRERFTSISPAVADLIAYANSTTGRDSNAGKYLFANLTTDGKTAVDPELAAIVKDAGGAPDPFGRIYGKPGGTPGANPYGDPRPFQTEPFVLPVSGPDYFGVPADNTVYSRGPISNLSDSPSYPSGHTTYGFMGGIVLALLVPERYPEMIARAAEYGNSRILVSAHYAMDVLGGRTLATYDLAHLLANDPAFMGRPLKNVAAMTSAGAPRVPVTITDFQASLRAARADVVKSLEAACGDTMAVCARQDIGRFASRDAVMGFVAGTQTYGLPAVHPERVGTVEDVNQLAPEAGHLLIAAFPKLSLEEANRILTDTQGPGGGFLDDGSPFGVYSRLNLVAAGDRAAAMTATR